MWNNYIGINKMKKIALIGGAYDPIHIGHVMMAYYTSKLNIFDEVWLMPCYESGWGKKMTDQDHRLNMCYSAMTYIDLITKGSIVRISDYEIKNKITGKTHIILERMEKDFPEYEFSLVIGQDNADNITKWQKHLYIINKYQFVVCPRDNRTPIDWYTKKPHILIENKLPEISSTDIRNGLKNDFGKYAGFVPQKVLEYMFMHELCGLKTPKIKK